MCVRVFRIKGHRFSVRKLLGPSEHALIRDTPEFSVAICRLAPQDYHRYHIPVDSTLECITEGLGEAYHTVNPMVVSSAIDVLGENKRTVYRFRLPSNDHRPQQYYWMVAVGALMVGSVITTAQADPERVLPKGTELGFFAFGGSTVVLLVPFAAADGGESLAKWDADLLENSSGRYRGDEGNSSRRYPPIETLVRMGMSIGTISPQ